MKPEDHLVNLTEPTKGPESLAEAIGTAFRKKPVVIEASQWHKNGDHPEDYADDRDGFQGGELVTFAAEHCKAQGWEGAVVRYYRHPDVPGERPCEQCGKPHHIHGWIDTLEQGHRVCPGDWIITGVKGERYPCKPDIFALTYEPCAERDQAVASERFSGNTEGLGKVIKTAPDPCPLSSSLKSLEGKNDLMDLIYKYGQAEALCGGRDSGEAFRLLREIEAFLGGVLTPGNSNGVKGEGNV